ncbi:MAG: transposase [Candidatus Eremiobacteraeota bacterium]|nr:transposase [Candidatus Eremiobacteraeota bacterium]
MRKSKFTETQIVNAVREYDAGVTAKELARRLGVSENTVRGWKAKYNGMEVADVVRLKQLEAENGQMQRIIARQTIKLDAMEELIRKNGWGLHSGKKR